MVIDIVRLKVWPESNILLLPEKLTCSMYLRVSDCSVLVVERSRKGSGKADCELHLIAPDFVYASMLFVVKLDVVVVVVVLLVNVVEEAVEVFCVLLVVASAFLVVTMLLIGAMSSRNGSSGAGVDVDAFLTEDSDDVTTDEEVVVEDPPINWSMAYHVKSWFLSGAFVEESSTATRGSMRSGRTERDWRETTLPLPRIMEGGTWGRGWRLSMKTLLVSLAAV